MPDLFIFLCNILFLIILSGFFSSSETALTAVSEARIHELALQGNKRAITIERILAKKEKMISTILIGNNLVNIVASVYATSFAIVYFGEFDLIFVTIFMSSAFFPTSLMEGWFRALAENNPITWTVDPIRRLVIQGWSTTDALQALGVPLLISVVTVSLAIRSLQKMLRSS